MKEIAEICSANCLRVEVETNCPVGGDGGAGGVTRLRITDLGGTGLKVEVNYRGRRRDSSGDAEGLALVLHGDSECETLIQALEWAAQALTPAAPRQPRTTGRAVRLRVYSEPH
jgi:hypothetical protein